MKVYLDNCCFNRPFDDQSSFVVRLETEAKLYVQDLIRQGELALIWSFMLDYENSANPFEEVRKQIEKWKSLAAVDYGPTCDVAYIAENIMKLGLKPKDSAHIACAVCAKADCFLTTDKKILNKTIEGIKIMNPLDFVRSASNA